MVVTHLVVAHSQLLTAIDLFFNDRDPISVHALAGNAREILESLCRLAAVEPSTELFLRDHPRKPKKDTCAALNLYKSALRLMSFSGLPMTRKCWPIRRQNQFLLAPSRFP
jgi:hypothetical protein